MSSVLLANVSDLAPSQQCIKPFMTEGKKSGEDEGVSVKINVNNRDNTLGHFDQIKTTSTNAATVSLQDCLACSGCVTSAETVLITNQSVDEFLTQHANAERTTVVTVSPQACVALAERYKCDEVTLTKRLCAFFHDVFGIDLVFDSTSALNLALMEAREEFVNRFRAGTTTQTQESKENAVLPLFASECPGWICYAEKVLGPTIIPHLSTVKSPQQIMGSYVKTEVARSLQTTPEMLYHVSIMPCFDKKLEGAREEFYSEELNTRDVDTVLTTAEIADLIDERCPGFMHLDIANTALDPTRFNVSADGTTMLRPLDTGASGGYLENVFRYAAQKLFDVTITGPLAYKQGRNKDLKEISLVVDGKEVLCFASAYGFRNIQNVVRKLKKNSNARSKYHYVEIMACPSGCLNGGGQLKLPEGKRDIRAQKALVVKLDAKYHEAAGLPVEDSYFGRTLYQSWVHGSPGSQAAQSVLHTSFKALDASEINPLAIKW